MPKELKYQISSVVKKVGPQPDPNQPDPIQQRAEDIVNGLAQWPKPKKTAVASRNEAYYEYCQSSSDDESESEEEEEEDDLKEEDEGEEEQDDMMVETSSATPLKQPPGRPVLPKSTSMPEIPAPRQPSSSVLPSSFHESLEVRLKTKTDGLAAADGVTKRALEAEKTESIAGVSANTAQSSTLLGTSGVKDPIQERNTRGPQT